MREKNLMRGLWHAILAMLLFWGIQYALVFLGMGVYFIYLISTGTSLDVAVQNMGMMENLSSLQIWITLISTVVTVLVFWKIKWFKTETLLTKGLSLKHAVLLGILLIGMSVGVSILAEFLSLPDLVGDMLQLMVTNPWGVLAVSIVGPIGEEVVFRGGALQQLMDHGWSPVSSIVVSALLFGIAHMNPVQIFFASILGLFLGWVYVRTKSLIPCIGLHILNNLTSVILSYLSDDPTASSVEQFGMAGAIFIMLAGILIAGGLFWYMYPRLKEMY